MYNLREDVGETVNRYDECPEVVERLRKTADSMRQELGDSLNNTEGCARRTSGYVENAKPLTEYREAPLHDRDV